MFIPVDPPKTKLGRYRLLAPTASVRVSPLCLGAMSIGEAWKWMGTMDRTQSFKILDTYYEAGGNFIDTAINYQSGESELWLGEWMAARENRPEMVIATKWTTGYRYGEQGRILVNTAGNSIKNLHESVKVSLERLQTDYIDLLYVHWWDYTTGVEEMMQALNVLVQQGKVLYLGISDTPAWVVAKANEYARSRGLRPFSVYQGKWSAADREFEREIIQMCRAEGMGICPWNAMGGGNFRLPEQFSEMAASGDKGRDAAFLGAGPSDKSAAVTLKLHSVAQKRGLSITATALAYVLSKGQDVSVIPIVGGRKVEHLMDNIKAIGVVLTQEEIAEIESAWPFEIGFPFDFLSKGPGPGNMGLDTVGVIDWPVLGGPIEVKSSL